MSHVSERLKELGLILPPAPAPVAAYIPAKRAGSLLFVSGQLPLKDGKLLLTGALASEDQAAPARQAMEQCFLNALAAACSVVTLDDILGVARLGAFVASTPDFTWQHVVANGASELALKLFGDEGRHSRSAVGVPSLPLGASVELEVQFLLR